MIPTDPKIIYRFLLNRRHKSYDIYDELSFIDSLGRKIWSTKAKHSRLFLLQQYLLGIRNRNRFDFSEKERTIIDNSLHHNINKCLIKNCNNINNLNCCSCDDGILMEN